MLLKKIWNHIANYLNASSKKFFISDSYTVEKELHIDEKTKKISVLIKTKSRSLGCLFEIDEILNNRQIIDNLDKESLKFVFYSAGMLEGAKKNDIYSLVKFDITTNQAIVRNTATLQIENWTISRIFADELYNKLDKQSIVILTKIYMQQCKQYIDEDNEYTNTKLRLVK